MVVDVPVPLKLRLSNVVVPDRRYSISYPVITPPSLTGALQLTLNWVVPAPLTAGGLGFPGPSSQYWRSPRENEGITATGYDAPADLEVYMGGSKGLFLVTLRGTQPVSLVLANHRPLIPSRPRRTGVISPLKFGFLLSNRTSRFSNPSNPLGMSPYRLFPSKRRLVRFLSSSSAGGILPVSELYPRSRNFNPDNFPIVLGIWPVR